MDYTHQRLPARVIDIGSHTSKLYLHEPSSGKIGCWAALSYRWGRRSFATTLSTLTDRKDGFEPDQLPNTCRDAVIVARALGIPYLWIDSICIVQGEESHWVWKREAATMCSIYENALVTFAAIDNEDSDAGLFGIDPHRQAVQLDLSIAGGPSMPVFARQIYTPGYYGFMSGARKKRDRSYNPSRKHMGALDTRGWTLQELALSKRILWFSTCEHSS